jgi:hypothetical protein
VFSSGDVGWFRAVGSRLFGEELGPVEAVSWPDPPPVADGIPSSPSASGRPGAAWG